MSTFLIMCSTVFHLVAKNALVKDTLGCLECSVLLPASYYESDQCYTTSQLVLHGEGEIQENARKSWVKDCSLVRIHSLNDKVLNNGTY